MIKELIFFLKSPNYKTVNADKGRFNIWYFIKVYFFTLISIKLADYLIFQLYSAEIISTTNKNIVTSSLSSMERSQLKLFSIIALVLTPILEETSFRLLLTRYKRLYVSISISLISSSIIYFIIKKFLIYFLSFSFIFKIILPYISICIIAFLLYFLIRGMLIYFENRFNLRELWKKYFSIIFYSNVILFAYFHLILNNYQPTITSLFFLMIPYLIYGIVLSFIRIKKGFVYSLLLHFFFLLPYFLFKIL